jgi:KipI family sensor histidine kinase inhibitor
LLCEADAPLNDEDQRRAWAVADVISRWDHVVDVAPCMNNLMVVFDPSRVRSADLRERLRAAWMASTATRHEGRLIDIPVVYGGARGLDLNDVAARTGLSVDEVVQLHSGGSYTVYAVGSQPGAPYIAGLNPKLFLPRRSEPLLRVQGGSVFVAALQTAVLVWPAPCGWHLIGATDVAFFDPMQDPPALLAPGDRIRFTVKDVVR